MQSIRAAHLNSAPSLTHLNSGVTCSSRAKQSFSCRHPDPPALHPHPPLLCWCDCIVENSFFPGSVCCWARQLNQLTAQSHKQKQALSVAAVSCRRSSAVHCICWNHSSSFLTFLSIFNWSHFPHLLCHAGSCREQLETTEHSIRPVFLANITYGPAASTRGAADMLSSATPEHAAQDSRNWAFFPSPVFQVPCQRQLLLNTECGYLLIQRTYPSTLLASCCSSHKPDEIPMGASCP